MNAALFWWLTAGIGLALVASGWNPARPTLADAASLLHARATGTVALDGRSRWWSYVQALGLDGFLPVASSDLRILGMTTEQLLLRRVLFALLGLVGPLVAATALLSTRGIAVPAGPCAALAIVLAVLGFVLPGLIAASDAKSRRYSFQFSLSAFLDVIDISLAVGRSIEKALHTAARGGTNWAFAELTAALRRSEQRGEPLWVGLDRLGGELDVPALQELADNLALAGENGARVRGTVARMAEFLRGECLQDARAAAKSASERLAMPGALMLLAGTLFVMYPPFSRMLS